MGEVYITTTILKDQVWSSVGRFSGQIQFPSPTAYMLTFSVFLYILEYVLEIPLNRPVIFH